MILIMKKTNLVLFGLILLLILTIFSLNMSADDASLTTIGEGGKPYTVLLDPGHGGEDPGAVSEYSGMKEKDISLKIAILLRDLLAADNYNPLLTREEDRLEYESGVTDILEKRRQDLKRRKKMMDEAGADIVVSIHLNKFNQTQYYGAQAFFPPKSAESRKLAVEIQKFLREMVDQSNTRVALEKKEQIIILKDLKTPTVIVECGFFSNPDEEKNLASADYQQKIAEAIKAGIDSYFK